MPLAELMDQISMVFQRVYLFQDTIYNNISMENRMPRRKKSMRRQRKPVAMISLWLCLTGSRLWWVKAALPFPAARNSEFRCTLHFEGCTHRHLDEATASVDTDNESYIQEAISELVKGKTLLVIAHRLNTIQNANQILVIDNGQIAQHGTHEELLEQPGIYQDFVNIRKNAAGWSLA